MVVKVRESFCYLHFFLSQQHEHSREDKFSSRGQRYRDNIQTINIKHIPKLGFVEFTLRTRIIGGGGISAREIHGILTREVAGWAV